MSQQNTPQKMFLFFSNYCEHCKRLMNRIKTTSLINSFNLVCIDDANVNIPDFIQVVPSLYDMTQRSVMTNETLFNWIEGIMSSQSQSEQNNVINMADITGSNDILAFQQTEMIGGTSGTAYSFIDDNDNDNLNHHYEYLDNRDNNKMVQFTKASENASLNNGGSGGASMSDKGKALSSAYDKMLSDRQSEMNNSLPAMRM
jgi:hypothetical protein